MSFHVKPGDQVAHSVDFLRAIFSEHDNLAHARGVVVSREPISDRNALITVKWGDDEIPPKILESNLAIVGPNMRFCRC